MRTFAQARKPASRLRRAPLSVASKGHVATPMRVREILHGARVQAKLAVGPPDDAYEREADQVADAVMRMPAPEVRVQRVCPECEEEMQRSPLGTSPSGEHIQRLCPECEEEMQRQPAPEEEEDEEKVLRAKETPGRNPVVTPDLESRIAALRGSGQPLPPSERAFFEPRFGRDFGDVRIHSGPEAADLAQRVHARAFTLGRTVVLGKGEDRPGTEAGRCLLGHELTHVVQQSASTSQLRRSGAVLQRQEFKDAGMTACDISAVTKECAGATATCSKVASECTKSFPQKKDRDALEKKYWDHVSSQKSSYPNAAANLEHFLNKTGTQRTIPVNLFQLDSSVQGVLVHHRSKFIEGATRRLKKLSAPPTNAVSWSLNFTSPGNAFGIPYTDLGLAVGGYQLCSVAQVTATPAGKNILGWPKYTITFANWFSQAFDCYNWDPGKGVPFVGNDTELCCLQNDGRGLHFLVRTDKWANNCQPSLAEESITI